jgi:hypothetical protein
MTKSLHEAILDDALAYTSFFNGRLLSGEDLARDQRANREARRRAAQAIGQGVAFGLEVFETPNESTRNSPTVSVNGGVAVSRNGHVLALKNGVDIRLVRGASASAGGAAGTFTVCDQPVPGVFVVGEGVYVLVMCPASAPQGRAPLSGLGNVAASCNVQSVVQGVQFRLVQPAINPQLLLDDARLRNRVASLAFGLTERALAERDPMTPHDPTYGLIDGLREVGAMTDCDVPLALIHWTAARGIGFVDLWAVRRRITRHTADARWQWLSSDRTLSESEALFLQFQEQIDDITAGNDDLTQIVALQRFDYLPPLGFLPLQLGSRAGFDPQTFFRTDDVSRQVMSRDIAYLDAHRLRPLLQESFFHAPIELSRQERVQLYLLFENVQVAAAGAAVVPVVVFARNTLPYRGTARYGFARYELGRFAPRVV